jgi:hypothetical protein
MVFGEEKGKRKREIEKRKKPEISLFAAGLALEREELCPRKTISNYGKHI